MKVLLLLIFIISICNTFAQSEKITKEEMYNYFKRQVDLWENSGKKRENYLIQIKEAEEKKARGEPLYSVEASLISDKEAIKKLVDDYRNKRGKYAWLGKKFEDADVQKKIEKALLARKRKNKSIDEQIADLPSKERKFFEKKKKDLMAAEIAKAKKEFPNQKPTKYDMQEFEKYIEKYVLRQMRTNQAVVANAHARIKKINFHGKVVDEDGKPIAKALVKYEIESYDKEVLKKMNTLDFSEVDDTEKIEIETIDKTKTNGGGIFKIKGEGHLLQIKEISKKGYGTSSSKIIKDIEGKTKNKKDTQKPTLFTLKKIDNKNKNPKHPNHKRGHDKKENK